MDDDKWILEYLMPKGLLSEFLTHVICTVIPIFTMNHFGHYSTPSIIESRVVLNVIVSNE